MNNSFPRLIDGMCTTLRQEVLSRLDDEFARGQVFGVINLLNTFKVRADWSAGFLLQQISAQRKALDALADLTAELTTTPVLAAPTGGAPSALSSIGELLTLRDDGNRTIGAWLAWFDDSRVDMPPETAISIERHLLLAMRAEVDIELKNAPRPLFAEMSSGQEA